MKTTGRKRHQGSREPDASHGRALRSALGEETVAAIPDALDYGL